MQRCFIIIIQRVKCIEIRFQEVPVVFAHLHSFFCCFFLLLLRFEQQLNLANSHTCPLFVFAPNEQCAWVAVWVRNTLTEKWIGNVQPYASLIAVAFHAPCKYKRHTSVFPCECCVLVGVCLFNFKSLLFHVGTLEWKGDTLTEFAYISVLFASPCHHLHGFRGESNRMRTCTQTELKYDWKCGKHNSLSRSYTWFILIVMFKIRFFSVCWAIRFAICNCNSIKNILIVSIAQVYFRLIYTHARFSHLWLGIWNSDETMVIWDFEMY